jgi:hypothetical protein
MTNDDWEKVRTPIVALQKEIIGLQASAEATRIILERISNLPNLSNDIKQIINSYGPLCATLKQEIMILIEDKCDAGLAAELDADDDLPPSKP